MVEDQVLSVDVLRSLRIQTSCAKREVVCNFVNTTLTTDHQELIIAGAATTDALCGVHRLSWLRIASGFSRRDIPDSVTGLSIGALLGVGASMSVGVRSIVKGRLAVRSSLTVRRGLSVRNSLVVGRWLSIRVGLVVGVWLTGSDLVRAVRHLDGARLVGVRGDLWILIL